MTLLNDWRRSLALGVCCLASAALGSSASAQCGPDGPLATHAELDARLGAAQIREDFEALNLAPGGWANIGSTLHSGTVVGTQGPGLVQPGAHYSEPASGGALFWYGDQYNQLTTQTLGYSGPDGIDIAYTTPVTACGFDVAGHAGFGYSGTATFYAANTGTLIGTVNFQIVNGGPERFFVGYSFAAKIGRVRVNAPVIDDHGYGACLPNITYCTAGTTTNGCVPSISGTGTPDSNAGSGYTISVANVEGQKLGILFYGISGAQAAAWGTGSSFLCVKAPTQRMGTQSSGGTSNACDGSLAIDWNAFIAANPTSLGSPYSGGETVWAQGWFRDPPSPKTTNLSNGLRFTVQP